MPLYLPFAIPGPKRRAIADQAAGHHERAEITADHPICYAIQNIANYTAPHRYFHLLPNTIRPANRRLDSCSRAGTQGECRDADGRPDTKIPRGRLGLSFATAAGIPHLL